MSRQTYLAKIRSGGIDFAKDILSDGDTPERICTEQPIYTLWSDIVEDAHTKMIPNSRIIDSECCFIVLSKADLIDYLSKDEYRKQPQCYSWLEKEEYEKIVSEMMDSLLSTANSLSDDEEYLLVACDMYSLEEWELEELTRKWHLRIC